MSTAGNLARVTLVLGSFIRALGMAGTSGAGLNSGGFCWAPAGRRAIVKAATAIHREKRGSHRNIVTPRFCATFRAAYVRRRWWLSMIIRKAESKLSLGFHQSPVFSQ